MPPLCSIVRMARVESRMRTGRPSISDSIDASCRFGRNRGRVLFFAWPTFFSVSTALPVIWQRRDIVIHLGPVEKARLIAEPPGSVKIGQRCNYRAEFGNAA